MASLSANNVLHVVMFLCYAGKVASKRPRAQQVPFQRGPAAGEVEAAEPADKTRWPELLGADGAQAQSVIAAVGKQAIIVKEAKEIYSLRQPQKALAWLAFISMHVLQPHLKHLSGFRHVNMLGFKCVQSRSGAVLPTSVGCKGRAAAQGTPVTRDYRVDRVRIYVDAAGKVAAVPAVG